MATRRASVAGLGTGCAGVDNARSGLRRLPSRAGKLVGLGITAAGSAFAGGTGISRGAAGSGSTADRRPWPTVPGGTGHAGQPAGHSRICRAALSRPAGGVGVGRGGSVIGFRASARAFFKRLAPNTAACLLQRGFWTHGVDGRRIPAGLTAPRLHARQIEGAVLPIAVAAARLIASYKIHYDCA